MKYQRYCTDSAQKRATSKKQALFFANDSCLLATGERLRGEATRHFNC
jgi:hypothetical protein